MQGSEGVRISRSGVQTSGLDGDGPMIRRIRGRCHERAVEDEEEDEDEQEEEGREG